MFNTEGTNYRSAPNLYLMILTWNNATVSIQSQTATAYIQLTTFTLLLRKSIAGTSATGAVVFTGKH